MMVQQALIKMNWGCSHTPFRVLAVFFIFFSLVLVNLMEYYWGTVPPSASHLQCIDTDCHCSQPTPHTLGIAQNDTAEGSQGLLAYLPANLVPLEMIRRKHSKHRAPYSIQGLSRLDKLSLSKFYECSPAKMLYLQSVGMDENTCYKQREFRRSGTSPLVALVSFQGSGNTWVRHILEQATGIYTGSIYCDSILKIAYPGEYIVSSNVLVVKTHHADTTSLPPDVQQAFGKKDYDKAIVLVRNPFNALLSEGNRRWTGMMQPMLDQHVGVADEQAFIGNPKWDWFVEYKGMSWVILLHTWLLQTRVKVMVVQYEKLQTNFTHELHRMLKFLEVPVSEERLRCVHQNKEGIFKRRVRLNFDPFSQVNKQAVNRIIGQAAPLLAKYNIHYEKR